MENQLKCDFSKKNGYGCYCIYNLNPKSKGEKYIPIQHSKEHIAWVPED